GSLTTRPSSPAWRSKNGSARKTLVRDSPQVPSMMREPYVAISVPVTKMFWTPVRVCDVVDSATATPPATEGTEWIAESGERETGIAPSHVARYARASTTTE